VVPDAAAPRSTTLVIIPAFNEEAALPSVLDELATRVPDLDVVVVDDGSVDGTAAAVAAAGLPCLRLPFNLGIGGALRLGFRYAVDNGYQRAVQFDADGQHDAEELATLLAGLDAGADLVIGSRFTVSGGTYEVGRTRQGAMGVLRLGVRLLSGRRFTDTSSGFRAFNRSMLEFFAGTYPLEYMDSVEALLLACRAGFRVDEVGTQMHDRVAGVPSARRLRLVYHYVRLLIVMLSSARRRSAGWA
jgi:glycosyltransferase involved in cell wall biosynthesis